MEDAYLDSYWEDQNEIGAPYPDDTWLADEPDYDEPEYDEDPCAEAWDQGAFDWVRDY